MFELLLMKQKIIIAGGTGFIGQALVNTLKPKYEIHILTRGKSKQENGVYFHSWDGKTLGEWKDEVNNSLAVINLSGKNLNCRHTSENKRDILNSRIDTTKVIGLAIKACKIKPKVWLNSSGINIYKSSLKEMRTESSTDYGTDFLAEVCLAWEKALYDFSFEGVRQIALRTSIVLGNGGGVMVPFKNLARFGLAGHQGSGEQYVSWIHLQDFCHIVSNLIEDENANGIFNLAAPNPVTNKHFMKALRGNYLIPFGIPTPTFLLKIGAAIIGTEPSLVLSSNKVKSIKIPDNTYMHPTVEGTFAQLIK